ncbi:MAG: helix-turn-helix domain-containing protein [Candidatus Aenigmarchaeota archaeon]|nr:helix-turn-helix domain-containing protein [Candidatus Aenigmarchaeota archaeon]
MDSETLVKENLSKRIAGEIVLSEDAGKIIQKWRNIFKIPQRKLADEMKIMPSVISDYENGRRKSPGIKVIKRIVEGMIRLDEKAGGKIIKEFSEYPTKAVLSDAIIDIKEFGTPLTVGEFCKKINAKLVVRPDLENNKIYGYTIIDSLKAIVDLPPLEMVKLYGYSSGRALIFSKARSGRSSMVALKVTNLRPGVVVLQNSKEIDDLARRIGENESIPIASTKIKDVDVLVATMKREL